MNPFENPMPPAPPLPGWYVRFRLISFWFLVIATPLSISGIEIGKVLFIVAALLSLFFIKPSPKHAGGAWVRVTQGLFILFVFWVGLSFAFSSDRGSSSEGTLRVLPVVFSQLLLSVAFFFFPVTTPPRKESLILLLAALAVTMCYSILTAGGERSRGFVGHPVVYSHILSLALCWTLLIFCWLLEIFYKKKSGLFILGMLACLTLFALAMVDIKRNDSRSLLLPLAILPVMVMILWSAARPKWLWALPLCAVFAAAILPASLRQKALNHIHPYASVKPTFQLLQGQWALNRNHVSLTFASKLGGPLQVYLLTAPNRFAKSVACDPEKNGIYHLDVDLGGPPFEGELQLTLTATNLYQEHARLLFKAGNATQLYVTETWGTRNWDLEKRPLWRLRFTFTEPHRMDIWQSSLNLIRNHPWFGVGPGNFKWASSQRRENPDVFNLRKELWGQPMAFHAHNNFLTLMSESGIPAAVFYGLLCGLLFARHSWALISVRRNGLREGREAFWWWRLATLLTFLVTFLGGLFDYTLFGVAGNIHWLAIGALMAWQDWETP